MYNINNVGLHRNGSLAVFKSIFGPLAEKITPQKTFKRTENATKCVTKIVEYLEVILNFK